MMCYGRAVLFCLAPLLASCGGGGGGGDAALPPAPKGEDPYYQDQWHLNNTSQLPGFVNSEDINAEAAWLQGYKGKGITVALVDDGLDAVHEDLVDNVSESSSWNYQFGVAGISTPSNAQSHGTLVAGLIAAAENNALGGRGVAPQATLAVHDLLWTSGVSDADVYDAMVRNSQAVHVSNNSWGLLGDDSGEVSSPVSTLWQQGVEEGATLGRGGKGVVYVWSAGNGGANNIDNANYSFQANNPYVMAVCAVDGAGKKTSYSEQGANLWLCAPSGDKNYGVITTDLSGSMGENKGNDSSELANTNYTKFFSGTSASTPIVSGVAALVLSVNPDLSWRDVRLILAQSARKNDSSDSDWTQTNPASGEPVYNINHKYGFGVVDAARAVALAKSWNSVGPMLTPVSYSRNALARSLPDNTGATESDTITVPNALAGRVIEYVTIEVDITHGYPGDLDIRLVAPNPADINGTPTGTESVLAEVHPCLSVTGEILIGSCTAFYDPWTFGSARHLGESPVGKWALRVADKGSRGVTPGTLNGWTLTFYLR